MRKSALQTRPLLVDLIDAFARTQPDAPALIADDTVLSYRDVARRSNALARVLHEGGVGAEILVGIVLERSVDMIVAVLAIWKAGGAYVPLDPKYPHDRLELMRDDAQLSHIITQSSTKNIFTEYTGAVYNIDTMELVDGADAPNVVTTPQQLAYVIYTSGSTGKPKGVMIEHAALNSLTAWLNTYFDRDCRRHVLASSSLSFDVSVLEYCAALGGGGALIIVRNILDLITRPPRVAVTFACTVPSPLAEVVRAQAIPASLHTVLIGGETLSQQFVHDIYTSTNIQRVYNAWGVTEDAVISLIHHAPRNGGEEPPIGLPIQGRRIYLLDEHLISVPAGTPGEICCAGEGVGRGYLRRPELTAARFIEDPFAKGQRLYRTGDLAVEDPVSGLLRYIGRNDLQVKIRGYRVELGEIEAVMHEHSDIAQAVVIARPISGQLTIALLAIPRPGRQLHLAQIQAFAADRLPAHMIPGSLTVLDAFPLGPSGKVDRRALAALRRNRPDLDTAYERPRGHIELEIASLFAELLDLERIGVHDNFFALGGQSLLATRAITEVARLFIAEVQALDPETGKDGPGILLTAFFAKPTIAHLAATLGKLPDFARNENTNGVRCWNEGQPGETPLFLLHGVIRGEALYIWNLRQLLDVKKPFYSFTPHGYDNDVVPESIEAMARDYRERIQAIQPHGPYEIAGYCNGGMVAFEIARQLRAQGEDVRKLLLIATPGTNTRFIGLYALLEALSWLPGFGEARRRQAFLTLRGQAVRYAQSAAVPDFLRSLGRAAAEKIRKAGQSQHRGGAAERSRSEREDARYAAIQKAFNAYVPRAYDGHIELLWGEDDGYLSASRPEDDWKNITASLRCTRLPGDHHFIESRPELLVPFLVDHPLRELRLDQQKRHSPDLHR